MSLIDFFKDYKDYIESNNSHSLVLSKSKGRNLFRFIQLQNFQKKYGDLLYKHFKVMDGPDEYEFLFDYFGKKTLKTAMQNEQATTQEIASILFKDKDFERLSRVFGEYLNEEFAEIGLVAYDVKFIKKPKTGSIPEWRGYNLEFKLIEREKFEKFGDDIEAIRRNAIKINESTQEVKYTVDISSYEYVDKAIKKDIDGLILRVYTPEMILIEKVRALCQTMPKYKEIVSSARQKKRARDLYDIWMICQHFKNLNLTEEVFKNIFAAKRVPLAFLDNFEILREQNREDWEVVRQTISHDEETKDYDYYFDFVKNLIEPFRIHEEKKDSSEDQIQ